MGVIVDTSVWIPALNQEHSPERKEVDRLIANDEVIMVGIVFVELLRGATNEDDFSKWQRRLSSPRFMEMNESTSLLASRLLYDLARAGRIIPLADAVIAAHALEGGHPIYAHDEHFERVPGLKLHQPPS